MPVSGCHFAQLLLVWCVCAMPALAYSQSFSNSTTGAIGDSTFCLGGTNANGNGVVNDLERTFNVSGLATVADLNLGFVATHTWRGDIDMRLESPLGTEVQIVVPDTSAAGNLDNYNIELSDEASELINTGSHNTANSVSAPLYEFEVSPDNILSAFDGENPNGTWTLKICDDYTGEIGTFQSAELIFADPNAADLSLSLTADNEFPLAGDTVVLTLTAFSDGPQNSTPTAQFILPAGVTFVSATGDGTYNSGTGIWSLGSGFTPGTPRSQTITVTVPSSGSFDFVAEINSSNRTDPDSTPNNGNPIEDDYSAISVFIQPPPTPPTLNCPTIDQFALAFSAPGTTNGWTSGDFTQNYIAADPVNSTNIDLDFTLTGDTGFLGQVGGSNTPVSQTTYTGGITPAEFSVAVAADFNTTSQFVTMNMDIGTPAIGVGALQFSIFDVDLGGWVDRIQVRGFLDGNSVTPLITPSAQNFVAGNEAIGTNGNAGATSAAGNITITFNQPVDRVEWDYGNDSSAGPNPAFQIIAMHEISMCGRRMADLSAVKTVEVYDPSSLGLYMTPGNEVLYKITVTNSASATANAEDIDISDTLPDNLKFVSANTMGFIGGAFGSPALPAANTDCGITPCIVRFAGGEVPINTTAEISVRALIK